MDNFSRTKLYFRVRQTAIEMLEDRGFNVALEDKNLPYEQFSNRLEENAIDFDATHRDSDVKMAYIAFILDTKSFSKKDLVNLKALVDEKFATKEMTIIIIVQDKPTPQIAKELLNEEYKGYEVFLMKNLIFNITHHDLVPKHIVLSEEEGKKVLDEYKTTKTQLPKLMLSDPVAKYYGMKSGNICKIIRQSPMTGESIYYRLVK